jgi:hypothetical protein
MANLDAALFEAGAREQPKRGRMAVRPSGRSANLDGHPRQMSVRVATNSSGEL